MSEVRESKVKYGNFVNIQAFMVKDLHLKGNELIVYAIIYGLSQGENEFNGSLQYLCDWTNTSKQSVLNNLKDLMKQGLISKRESMVRGRKACIYKAVEIDWVNKVDLSGQKSLPTPVKNFDQSSGQKSLPNNIDSLDTIDDTKDDTKPPNPQMGEEKREKPPLAQPQNGTIVPNSRGIDYEAFATAYNQNCTKLPSCRKMTEKRKTAVRKFLKEYSFADWQKVCELANTSSFLCGASERGWRADFDWLLKTEKATKILEGGYQGGSKSPVARQWDRMTLRDYHNTYSDDSGCEDDFDIGDENE